MNSTPDLLQVPCTGAVLLVVDITRDVLMPAEVRGIPLSGAADALTNALRVLSSARDARIPIVFVHERHRRDGVDFGRELDGAEGVHCVEDDPATELHDDFRPQSDRQLEYYVPKRRYSAFFGTDLEILLRGLKAESVILVGFLTDVCIHYTAVDAHQHDYRIRVVRDAVAGSSLSAHEAALEAMEYLQAGAVITSELLIQNLGISNFIADGVNR